MPLPDAEANTLYTCENQQTIDSFFCRYGCCAAPLGEEDRCL